MRTGSGRTKSVLLVNMIPPYRVPLLKKMQTLNPNFQIIVDVERESDREWDPIFEGINFEKAQGKVTLTRSSQFDAGRDFHVQFSLLSQLNRLKPEIIITTELGSRSLWARVYKFLNPKTELCVWLTLSERTEKNRGMIRRIVRRFILRGADSIFVSSASAERYVRGLTSKPSIVCAPQTSDITPVKSPSSKKLLLPNLTIKLLFVGNDSKRKNLSWTLDQLGFWALKNNQKVSLTIAGSLRSLDLLEQSKKFENLEVTYAGFLGRSNLSELYDSHHALIFPSLEDEWGMVVSEAMARATPVIGSSHSEAVVELILPDENGWIFEPTLPETLHSELSALSNTLASPDKYIKVCEAALEASIRAHRTAIDNVLLELVAN